MSTRERQAFSLIILVLASVLAGVTLNLRRTLREIEYPVPSEITVVSCQELIENPGRFDGKVVQTTGYILLASFLNRAASKANSYQ